MEKTAQGPEIYDARIRWIFFAGAQGRAVCSGLERLGCRNHHAGTAQADIPAAFRQAVAEAASTDEAVASFYRENSYQAIWTGSDEASLQRRNALLAALNDTRAHGLPDRSAEVNALLQQMREARTTRDIGMVEAALSKALVDYATDLQTGLLVPSRIDDGMVRKKHTVDGASFLAGIRDAQPFAYMRGLVPASPQYRGLMREKLRLEQVLVAAWLGARGAGQEAGTW